jgi:hypothetical protein
MASSGQGKETSMKHIRLLVIAGTMLVLAAAGAVAANAASPAKTALADKAAQQDTSPVGLWMSPTLVAGAWTKLVRNDNGVGVTVHTTGLTPGTADTVWWVFFNNPAACLHGMFGARCGLGDVLTNPASLPSVQFAAGHVIGGGGVGNYGAYFSAGAAPDCAGFGLPCDGLLDARTADVHVVIRTHGEAIPGLVDEQISSFNGGCLAGEPNVGQCHNVQASVHEAG